MYSNFNFTSRTLDNSQKCGFCEKWKITVLTKTGAFSAKHKSKVKTTKRILDSTWNYRVSQKNVVSWKNSHNYPQTYPKWKSLGCFGKFRIFVTSRALRFSKLKKKWFRKWSLKLPTPLQKWSHNTHSLILLAIL